jgi:hypothetical protein
MDKIKYNRVDKALIVFLLISVVLCLILAFATTIERSKMVKLTGQLDECRRSVDTALAACKDPKQDDQDDD